MADDASEAPLGEQDRRLAEQGLQQTDSIMNADVFALIGRFLQAGGQPTGVVSLLTSSFTGVSGLCTLIARWASMLGEDTSAFDRSLQALLTESVLRRFDDHLVDEAAAHLEGMPEWLAFMLSVPEWRKLLCSLCLSHQQSMLLSLAVQRLSEMNLDDEIMHIPLAYDIFPIFQKVLSQSLVVSFAGGPVGAEDDERPFVGIAQNNDHTFLYAVLLLKALRLRHPTAGCFDRMLEELCLRCPYRYVCSRIDLTSFSFGVPYQSQIADCLHALRRDSENAALAEHLFSLVSQFPAEAGELSKFLYRHGVILQVVDVLFKPRSSSQAFQPAAFLNLLSFVLANLRHVVLQQHPPSRDDLRAIRDHALRLIASCAKICRSHHVVSDMTLVSRRLLPSFFEPVVCHGYLVWSKYCICSAGGLSSSVWEDNCRVVLRTMLQIVETHPQLVRVVVDYLKELVRWNFSSAFFLSSSSSSSSSSSLPVPEEIAVDEAQEKIKFRKMVFEQLAWLSVTRFSLSILRFFRSYVPQMDQSIVRPFLQVLGESISGNFSAGYAQELYEVVLMQPVRNSFSGSFKRDAKFVNLLTLLAASKDLSLSQLQQIQGLLVFHGVRGSEQIPGR